MAYGNDFSAVQSASLAEKQMSNGIVNTLIGVLQNRKQLQQQDQQFQQQHALALMQANKVQDELDWRKNLAEKELQAKASVLDFEKAKQANSERQFAQSFTLSKQAQDTATARETEFGAANRLKEKAFSFDSEQQRTQNDRSAIADYQAGMERYKYASVYADTLNEVHDLERKQEDNAKKHSFWGSNDPGYEDPKDIAKALASANEHLNQLKATKGVSELAVFSLPAKKYVPVVRPPPEPTALRSSGTDTESGNIDSGVGFNPLLRGAAPPEASGSPVSDPATAQAPAQGDPRIAIYTQLVSSGMPDREAISEADRRYKAMLNQARYGGPSGF